MNKQEYLLTDEAIYKRCEWRSIPTMQDVARIQLKHTLEQLEKEGRIKHEQGFFKVTEADKKAEWSSNWEHNSDYCWLCAALREVEGK